MPLAIGTSQRFKNSEILIARLLRWITSAARRRSVRRLTLSHFGIPHSRWILAAALRTECPPPSSSFRARNTHSNEEKINMADASIGEIEIVLDGTPVTLRSSLEAAKKVGAGGGYIHALSRLGAMDHDAYVHVVAAGLNKKPSDVDAAVFKTGIMNLTVPLCTYVEYLVNGGKPAATAE
jgi:hypothetical protein